MRTSWLVAALTAITLAACGSGGDAPTGVATNPPGPAGTGASAGSSPSASGPGVRTVLSPLGLNIHSAASISSPHVGTAAQGVVLAVIGHTDQGGGWYQVQGQTVTGWITSDPALSAPGQFQEYTSSARNFSALYPQDWTFAEEPADTLFHPLDGPQSIVIRTAASASAFGPAGGSGYLGAGQQTVVVCGVTGNLDMYARSGNPSPTPAPGSAGSLALLAQIRLRLDATHAMALDFNYSAASDLAVFADVYNSMTFPFPACQAPAPPAPSPT